MVADNTIYRLELCGDIKDGTWNDWQTVEKCVGVKNIGSSNYTCGPGQILQRRICSRSLGGKYCEDEDTGVLALNDVMVRTALCQDVVCPGQIVHDNIT